MADLSGRGRRLLIVVNVPAFFLSHRLPIALAARAEGYDVHIATGPGPGVEDIQAHGLTYHRLSLSRTGTNPFAELKGLLSVARLLYRIRPSVLHLVSIKPVLYGGFAARLFRSIGVVAAVSGLGSMFDNEGPGANVRQRLLGWAYRVALGKRALRVVFQNEQDRQVLARLAGLPLDKTRMLRGSGVDLSLYVPSPEASGPPAMLFASRLLRSKGVMEFVEAARLLRDRGIEGQFWIAGEVDSLSPDVAPEDALLAAAEEGIVSLLGHRTDIPALLGRSHAMVLPSYYGEGVPKVLLEAAACARPVVTTDHPGCRDAIVPGETGLLVPVRDPEALADAMQALIENADLRQSMGQAGRRLAQAEFSDAAIAKAHLNYYHEAALIAAGVDL